MPRQKDTRRIDPTRVRSLGQNTAPTESCNVFDVSGSPIVSPRSIRHCVGADSDGNLRSSGVSLPDLPLATTTISADAAAKEAHKALEAEQVATASLQELSGVQLVVHQMLATHTRSLAQLGVARAEYPNTSLSLNQVETMLRPVVTLCNALRADHFGIHVPMPQIACTMNDVRYWKLWESDSIDIGVFFMPPKSAIPLHNHPGMSVVTRVLYGVASVSSYDILSAAEVQTLEAGSEIVYEDATFSSGAVNPEVGSVSWARVSREGHFSQGTTTWLDPRQFNLHSIQAGSGIGCAVLDIMVPPYDNANRDCHHFKMLEQKMVHNERIVKVLESVKPGKHMDPPMANSLPSYS